MSSRKTKSLQEEIDDEVNFLLADYYPKLEKCKSEYELQLLRDQRLSQLDSEFKFLVEENPIPEELQAYASDIATLPVIIMSKLVEKETPDEILAYPQFKTRRKLVVAVTALFEARIKISSIVSGRSMENSITWESLTVKQKIYEYLLRKHAGAMPDRFSINHFKYLETTDEKVYETIKSWFKNNIHDLNSDLVAMPHHINSSEHRISKRKWKYLIEDLQKVRLYFQEMGEQKLADHTFQFYTIAEKNIPAK